MVCFNCFRLIDNSNYTLIYAVSTSNSICSFISISTLLQDCHDPWFSSNLCFSKKMHIEKELEGPMIALEASKERSSRSHMGVRIFAFVPFILRGMQMWLLTKPLL